MYKCCTLTNRVPALVDTLGHRVSFFASVTMYNGLSPENARAPHYRNPVVSTTCNLVEVLIALGDALYEQSLSTGLTLYIPVFGGDIEIMRLTILSSHILTDYTIPHRWPTQLFQNLRSWPH
jgi:hypothetical protein